MPQDFIPLLQQSSRASYGNGSDDLDDLVSPARKRYTVADIEHRVHSFELTITMSNVDEILTTSGRLSLEARQKFQAGRYESALELFIQCLGYHGLTHGWCGLCDGVGSKINDHLRVLGCTSDGR